MGTITIKQGENKFKIQIRQGNCLAVFIHVSKQEDGQYLHTLYSFYADEQHLKNIIKKDGKPFWDEVVSVELNMYYKESAILLKHLVEFYKVKCYYKGTKKGRLIYKLYKTKKSAERYMGKMRKEYDHVRLVDTPKDSECGIYVIEVK